MCMVSQVPHVFLEVTASIIKYTTWRYPLGIAGRLVSRSSEVYLSFLQYIRIASIWSSHATCMGDLLFAQGCADQASRDRSNTEWNVAVLTERVHHIRTRMMKWTPTSIVLRRRHTSAVLRHKHPYCNSAVQPRLDSASLICVVLKNRLAIEAAAPPHTVWRAHCLSTD